MKKFNLEIAEPCHEKWDQMSDSNKGKFCSSCNKTVIDFTDMSDRQLAEFFKKQKTNVCGRLLNDQMNRTIEIPGKRIPWVKYFFQFTWPAFVFFLKSCGEKKENRMEIPIKSVQKKSKNKPVEDIGTIIQTTDERKEIREKLISKKQIKPFVSGNDTKYEDSNKRYYAEACDLAKENISNDRQVPVSILEPEPVPMERLVFELHGRVGGVSVNYPKRKAKHHSKKVNKQELTPLVISDETIKGFNIFPSLVTAGSAVTIKYPEDKILSDIMIISSSGQLIEVVKPLAGYSGTSNIQIPNNISAGVYFIRLTDKAGTLHTSKLVITK